MCHRHVLNTIKTTDIEYFQCQLMCSDTQFNADSNFAIKHCLNFCDLTEYGSIKVKIDT